MVCRFFHRPRGSALAGILLLWLVVVAAGCSTKPAAQEVKGADTSAKPIHTPEDAEAVFAAAEDELAEVLASGNATPVPPAGLPPDSLDYRPAPAVTPSPMRTAEDRCTRACRALASMQRAADRMCELTGEDDARCKRVRDRVDAARTDVQASCPRCES